MISGMTEKTYEESIATEAVYSKRERERGDLIIIFKSIKELEGMDRKDLFVVDNRTRWHKYKVLKVDAENI